jgi:hypothetical protein
MDEAADKLATAARATQYSLPTNLRPTSKCEYGLVDERLSERLVSHAAIVQNGAAQDLELMSGVTTSV